jgi:hypothetical protein
MLRVSSIVVFALLMTFALPATSAAQPTSNEWEFTVMPYLMGAAISGTQTIRGREADVDLSASDIFSNLEFGAMGAFAARKGDWGFGSDAIWMALGAPAAVGPVSAEVDFDQGAFAFYGLRRLSPAADVTFGLRVNYLRGKLAVASPIALTVDQSQTWVDPIVGLNLRSPHDRRVFVRVYSEIGGFGLGSTFAWQIFPTVGVNLGRRSSIDFGYRWLDIDYETGEGNEQFAYDTLTQGPVIGFTFRF